MNKLHHIVGYTPGNWHVSGEYDQLVMSDIELKHFQRIVCEIPRNRYPHNQAFYTANSRLIAAAPAMLEALVDLVIDGMANYQPLPNRRSPEEYFGPEIAVIEAATGKTWEELNDN